MRRRIWNLIPASDSPGPITPKKALQSWYFNHFTYFGDFRSHRFSDDKTGSGHFQGIVPNIFISKSMTRLRFMPILIWFNKNLFFVRSTCRLISAVGANPGKSIKIGARVLFKHSLIDKISKNWKVIFGDFFLIFDLVKNHHFWPIKYRLSQNRLPVSLWKCENQVRDRKLGLETCLVDQFCDFHFWPSIHVRVPKYNLKDAF